MGKTKKATTIFAADDFAATPRTVQSGVINAALYLIREVK